MAFGAKKIFPIDTKPGTGVGIGLPFNAPAVFKTTYTTKESVKYNLINFFLTNQPERYLNPTFGGNLRAFIFQQISEGNVDSYIEILLTNSHDGSSTFRFEVGIFRLVCSNGLVISDADFNNVSIRHINYTFETLQSKVQEVIAKLPGLVKKINLFKSTQLTEAQMQDFATKAATLRTKQRVNVMDLLNADRAQDQGNDLWVVFNRVQEKLLGGSYRAGQRKARSVKNFQKDIELNEQLFELAGSYL